MNGNIINCYIAIAVGKTPLNDTTYGNTFDS